VLAWLKRPGNFRSSPNPSVRDATWDVTTVTTSGRRRSTRNVRVWPTRSPPSSISPVTVRQGATAPAREEMTQYKMLEAGSICYNLPALSYYWAEREHKVITNRERFDQFEREYVRSRKADYRENLKIFEALYQEAASLGVLPLKDPLEGLEVDIRMARVINGVREPS
jgi:hypothetical protein